MTVTNLLNGLNDKQCELVTAQLRLEPGMVSSELEHDYYELAHNIENMYFPRLRLHCGQLDTLFDSVADFHDYHINWVRMNNAIWSRYFRTMVVKYNVIHNTDKTQEETTSATNTDEGFSFDNSSSNGSSDNTRTANNTESGSSLHQLSAANQTDFHNKTKDTTNGTISQNESDTGSSSASSEHEQEYNNTRITEVTHKIRAYGNIGVTTNQQMLAEERQHLAFNVLDKIIEDFKKEFCIMIY